MSTPTEPQTQRDYVSVGLSENKKRVKVTLCIRGEEGGSAWVELEQEQALALAGEIQGWALQIRKP